jgi:hypothetical protein
VSVAGAGRTIAIAGFLLAGAAILVIGFFLDNRAGTGALPPLRILEPATGAVLANPITVRFATPAELRLTSAGWAAGPLHLHLMLDGREVMPAASDIAASDSGFAWRLPPLPPGDHDLYLAWAARHHGNLPGTTDTVAIRVTQ